MGFLQTHGVLAARAGCKGTEPGRISRSRLSVVPARWCGPAFPGDESAFMTTLDRRALLRAGLLLPASGVLAACTSGAAAGRLTGTTGDERRRATGRTHAVTLAAMAGPIDLGGPMVTTWTYDGVLPGREIRVRRGDVIEARLVNKLPAATTIHWHGLAVPNAVDGVPGVTQAAVSPGNGFTYRFTASTPGTYWFHPHTGTQLDRGLYAPLIVEDPDEPAAYDHEWTVVLDDWIDGTGYTPSQLLRLLRRGMGAMNMGGGGSGSQGSGGMGGSGTGGQGRASSDPLLMGAASTLLGGDAGDISYPYYLVNGRVATAPHTFRARPGQRARIRLINAGGDTAFRVALGGHRMLVTHTDGYPVTPVETDALLIGMGERYDVTVDLGDGVFPLTALAEGKDATGCALVRTRPGAAPAASARPDELAGRVLGYGQLQPTSAVALPATAPDEVHTLDLTGGMMRYDWGINGRPFNPRTRVPIREGQRIRITFRNRTTMFHPMHIHGHTFQISGSGPRKDTVNVLPGQAVTCDFNADNPGQWMTHCHNVYHAEAGMMTILGYRT